MIIQNYKFFHFIGCGGAGMVGLAIIMHEKGFKVTGSDLKESANTELLREKGIQVFTGHSPANIPKNDKSKVFIVRSSAVSDSNPEFAEAVSRGCRHLRRGEFLAEFAKTYKCTISIAGCHGKTSVTGIVTHILKECGRNPGYMVGGKVTGWKYSGGAGDGNVFVTESDESDGTQVHLKSDIAVVTNVEDDHSWNVGGEKVLYNNFAKFAENSKKLIYAPCPLADKIFAFHKNKREIDLAQVSAKFADMKDWGAFQRNNAAIAVEAATEIGIDRTEAEKHARTFPGIERRMSVRLQKDGFVLIEDYAHHPTEVSASISALRERFPGYYLRVVFQPHRYARLEKYIGQLACELRKADEVIIVPVFAAWTEKGKVSSEDLVAKIGKNAKFADSDWQILAGKLSSSMRKNEVLAIIGAGDIDELIKYLIV
ncbi:MAG: Mur ligase domain-containing protein [Lentisphaerae bacterium]|nr:Mur ligase domain-containing protein [Lentisphaerota bacterium]